MGTRIKSFDATGIAPAGKLFAGDLNSMQDQYADLVNYAQTHGIGTLAIGEAGLQLLRYGTGEARLTGLLRTDGLIRGLGGLFAGTFTTVQRDAIPAGQCPFGLMIFNTTKNLLEINLGSDATPSWRALSYTETWADTTFYSSPGTGDQDLSTITIPGGRARAGDIIEVTAGGSTLGNAGNKTVKLFYGTQQLLSSGTFSAEFSDWSMRAMIYIAGSTSQNVVSEWHTQNDNRTGRVDATLAVNRDISVNQVIKIVGNTVNAGDDVSSAELVAKLTHTGL